MIPTAPKSIQNVNIPQKQISRAPLSKAYLQTLLPRLGQKKTQQVTTLALTFFTLSIFGLFAISPTLGTITDLQKQLSDDQYVDQQLQTKIANLSTLQQKYQSLQSSLPFVDNALPSSPNISLFVGQIQSLAATNNVLIPSIQTFPVDVTANAPTKYVSYAFSFEAQGSYAEVVQFAHDLANFNRSVTFDTIALTTTNIGSLTSYHISFRGKTYFKPE